MTGYPISSSISIGFSMLNTPSIWDTLWWTNIAIENGHRNSGISHEKWWFSIAYVSSPEGTPVTPSTFLIDSPWLCSWLPRRDCVRRVREWFGSDSFQSLGLRWRAWVHILMMMDQTCDLCCIKIQHIQLYIYYIYIYVWINEALIHIYICIYIILYVCTVLLYIYIYISIHI